MITKYEKKAIVWMLTAIMCLTAVLSGNSVAYAQEEEGTSGAVESALDRSEASDIPLRAVPGDEKSSGDPEEAALEEDGILQSKTEGISGKNVQEAEEEEGISGLADEQEDNARSARSAETEGDYEYELLEDDTAVITKYNGTAATVSVPGTLGGKMVSSIGEHAFRDTSVVRVELPATVTSLQYWSFGGCSNLKNIILPADSQLKTIGRMALSGSGLEELNCPSVQEIGSSAFSGCDELKTVIFGEQLTTLGAGAFWGSGLQTLNIPGSLTEIKGGTFCECKNLKNIVLPNNIVSIGTNSFGYSGLEKIEIPDSVTSIGDYAFSGCSSLNSATIGNKLAYISTSAFQDCGLTTVTIGEQVKTIGHYAFEGNERLSEVVIPKNVTKLEYAAFRDCKALAGITFPDSLERIGGLALDHTTWYENQADGVVYAGNVLYKYKGSMPAGTSVTVKDGTLGIAAFAFEKCSNLEEISIPGGVTNIGEFAFYDCGGMTSVTIPASVTEIGQMALGYIASENGTPFKGEDLLVNARGNCAKIPNFTIYGKAGSAAQTYARENEFEFHALSAETAEKVPASKPSAGTPQTLRIVPEATDYIYVIDSGEEVTITCTGEFKDFVSVYMDGREVDRSNYTVREGSTILTFMTKYLNTLSVGKHKVTMNYTYGSVDTELNVLERQSNTAGVSVSNNTVGTNSGVGTANRTNVSGNTNSPKTGDDTLLLFWMLAIFMATGAGAVMVRKKYMA